MQLSQRLLAVMMNSTTSTFTAPFNLVGTFNNPNIDYTWSANGSIESYNYYRSLTPMNTGSMPSPTATGITSQSYSDTTAEIDQTYYVRFGSVKGGSEKISDEITIDTTVSVTDPYFSDVDYLVIVDGGAIVDKSNNARTITNVGGATVGGDQIVFNGANYLYLDTDNLQNRNFTIEWFAARNLSVSDQFMGMWSGSGEGGNYPSVFYGYGIAYLNANSSLQNGGSVENNSYENHWCIEYNNATGIAYLFYNGTLIAQITYGVGSWNSNSAKIALTQGGGNKFFTGSMRAIRCTLDVLRYDVAGFTPPTEFPTS